MLFRERLLARLVERHAISPELADKLLSWRHPGFSAHIGEPIPFEDRKAIEDVASYLVKAPLSLKKLGYLDGQKAVVYRSKMNPALGRDFEAMVPLEWLARLGDHIPDPGKHRTLAYGHYASRARGARAKDKAPPEGAPAEVPRKRRCSPNWPAAMTLFLSGQEGSCVLPAGRLRIALEAKSGSPSPNSRLRPGLMVGLRGAARPLYSPRRPSPPFKLPIVTACPSASLRVSLLDRRPPEAYI